MSRTLKDLRDDELVQLYIMKRDNISKKKAAYDLDVADETSHMDKIESTLLGRLIESGAESVRTKMGTAYKILKKTSSIADWDILLKYVQTNDAWELLTRGVNKTVVEQYLTTNQELPPGVNFRTEVVLGFRRPTSTE